MRSLIMLAIASVAVAQVAVAQEGGGSGAAEGTRRAASEDGVYSVALPAAWEVEPRPSKRAVWAFGARVPGLEDRLDLTMFRLEGQFDPLAQAYYERPVQAKRVKAERTEVEPGSPPLLLVWYQHKGEKLLDAFAYQTKKRVGLTFVLTCRETSWPRVRDSFLGAARSLEAKIDEWPPHPPELERSEKDGYVYLVHPSVKAGDLRRLQSFIRRHEIKYEKVHGKVAKPADHPPLVVVYNTIKEARSLYDLSGVRYGSWTDPLGLRLFATPLPDDDDAEQASLARSVFRLLHVVKYGGHNTSYWMYLGEGRVAWAEERTGARLPAIHKDAYEDLPGDPLRFDELLRRSDLDSPGQGFDDHALAYLLLFRAGPAKYRKAYKSFRKEFAATRDAHTAAKNHLLPLDQSRLRADLRKFLNTKVKVARKK